MKIIELMEGVSYQILQGDSDREIVELVYDSRKVTQGSVFVCISGAVRDGHDFAGEVVEKGAKVLIVEKPVVVPEYVTVIQVDNSRLALAFMSAAYFGHPARKIKTIGITGTKGKTTTTYMVQSILEKSGIKTGLIGTIETMIGNLHIPSSNTTPESYIVQETFKKMVDAGCQAVVMEVSSQGLMLHRVGGFVFDYGIFTNLEPDHIGPNEHKDMEEYIHCKSMLFQQCKHGILNIDSEYYEQIIKGHTCTIETYGFSKDASLRAQKVELMKRPGWLGVSYEVKGIMDFQATLNVPGKFSVYNSLSAIAICRHFKVEIAMIQKVLCEVNVKGRIEMVPISDKFTVMIDYAHNAMSLESLLVTLREYNPSRLVCLFGCGGNRSKQRRYEMGEISSRLADLTVVTSDNPRDEEPQAILDDIVSGVKKASGEYITIIDRKEAIKYCIEHAKEGDVIIFAGKGHEDYQEIKGKKYHMDERELIQQVLEGR
ncbi:MAG: UDP-N-acetylmuramoyl-L-alanyl-D-glutamate--2,6-diaminopimelate ligase [Velocimicrobium sp.]